MHSQQSALSLKYAIKLCIGEIELENQRKTLELKFDNKTSFEVPYNMISQCAVPGKNEIEIQFEDDDTGPREDELLVQIRFSIPAGMTFTYVVTVL